MQKAQEEECVPSSPVRTPVDSPANYIKSLESHIACLEQYVAELEEVACISNPEVVKDHLSMQRSPILSGLRRGGDQSPLHSACLPYTSLSGSLVRANQTGLSSSDDSTQHLGNDYGLSLPGEDSNSLGYLSPFELGFGSCFGFGAQVSTQLSNAETTRSLSRFYERLYFTNVQSSWPFLQESRWKEWAEHYGDEMLLPGAEDWRGFFVDMVRSVGALVAQKFEKGSQHIDRSKSFHERAKKSLPQALSQPSPILHTQSSLLLTIHAMHSESADNIDDYASNAMMYCALSGLYHDKVRKGVRRDQVSIQDDRCENMVRRQVMRVCYGLDSLIAMAFDRPVFVADELIDTESLLHSRGDNIVFQDAADSSPETMTGVAESDHRFHLRQIQSKIHSTVERLEYHALCQNKEVTNLWNSELRLELDQWKAELAHVQDPMSSCSTQWLSNLYFYNVLALFPNMNLAANGDALCHVVSASSEVLRNFRFIQIPDQKSCYTWTALVHQFQAGISLLYCFWAAPYHLAHEVYGSPDVDVALLACSATLAEFALRWESAKHFKAAFDLLNDAVVRKGRRSYDCSWQFHNELYQLIGELKKGRAHRRVLKLIEEMSGAVD
ncbi:uncharacterized protein LY89DRAFT_733375 [Mollisia scopiformis]|uniref:Xylanolytic transcriptional activator regulatory domain-containing protein n=1 Tax=Mollisia scopiformis TaxID=149040 RepID=A0A194XBI6_MOLSC|nr:uncharacterized protein LY89DRAFT_733375 [Mollisia scopiformis]KUJ17530.1 hypothetical protein LY89DRAFT_733375 [Mollisia scopiformis]